MRTLKSITLSILASILVMNGGAVWAQSNTAVADSGVSIGFQSSGGAVVAAGVGISFQSGGINVTTNLAAATFTISGPTTYSGSGTAFNQPNAAPGQYTITFGAVTGYTTPGPQSQTLSVGGAITFTGSYASVLPPGSSLGISPASLAFWYQQGTSTPSPQIVNVSSTGTLTFTATGSTQSGGAWLSVSPTSGTTGTPTATLAITVAPQSLKTGAYIGQITITSTQPPVILPVIVTVTPNTPAVRQMNLSAISGWYAPASGTLKGKYVKNATWQGQPNVGKKGGAPNSGQYYLDYAIDACQKSSPCPTEGTTSAILNPSWTLTGSGFCPTTGCNGIPGSLVFSDPAIMPVVFSEKNKGQEWTTSSITFTPSFAPNVSFQYTNHTAVSVIITSLDGANQSLKLPSPGSTPDCTTLPCNVVSTIATRGYGQCTWFVANQRLQQGLPIPYPNAYGNTAEILPTAQTSCNGTGCYIPQQWDVINFDSQHTAIIISPITTTNTPQADGSTLIAYNFTVGEMNVGICSAQIPPGLSCKAPAQGECGRCPWSEQQSSVKSTFQIIRSSSGTQTLKQGILSFYSKTDIATGYFR